MQFVFKSKPYFLLILFPSEGIVGGAGSQIIHGQRGMRVGIIDLSLVAPRVRRTMGHAGNCQLN